MARQLSLTLGDGRTARLVFTDASDGDFQVVDPAADLEDRRRRIVDRPWSWQRQVHGDVVRRVHHSGDHAGAEGDGLLTTESGCPVSVTTADCAPVVLVAAQGLAVVHAGWRGLVAGIVEKAGQQLQAVAGEPLCSIVGPCIGPASYQFGPGDLAAVIDRYGPGVEGRTEAGELALDMPAAAAAACRRAGWPDPGQPECTSDPQWFSHRVRRDRARQCAVAWLVDDPLSEDRAGE